MAIASHQTNKTTQIITMEDDDNDHLVITEEEQGQRLDKILAQRFATVKSRSYFHYLIAEEKVLVNGQPVKKRTLMKAGDEIEINFVCSPELTLEPQAIPLDIIFEDESLVIVNKPAGMVVHPAAGNWSDTFVNALLYHYRALQFENANTNSLRPGIVHRLDKNTSGIIVAAKNGQVQQQLSELFADRQVHKEYLAICCGRLHDMTIDLPIGRHPVNRKKMAIAAEGGKRALSLCRQLAFNDKLSLAAITLVTGRTHQIRVHMQHNNTAILGDDLYGNEQLNKKYGAARQMLHAHIIRFKHPLSKQMLEFKAPLPNDMSQLLQREGLSCGY